VGQHIAKRGKKQIQEGKERCFPSKNLNKVSLYFIKKEYLSSGRILRYQERTRRRGYGYYPVSITPHKYVSVVPIGM
jgi:hypothetical protein